MELSLPKLSCVRLLTYWMCDMNKTQKRVVKVLERMIDLAKENEDDADMFSEELEYMLDGIAENDGFGTERTTDPRGDFRDYGGWSMTRVQGVDK